MDKYDFKLMNNLMDKKTSILLQFYLFFCNKLINEDYKITESEIFQITLFSYKTNKNIFNNNSILNKFFHYSTYLYELFKSFDKHNLLFELKRNLQDEFFSKDLILLTIDNLEILFSMYSYRTYGNLQNISKQYFEDKYFEFYNIELLNDSSKNFSYFSNEGVTFVLVLNGSIKINDKFLLSNGDILICNKNNSINNCKIYTENCTILLYVVKLSFLDVINFKNSNFNYKVCFNSFNKETLNFTSKKDFFSLEDYYNLMYLGIYLLYLTLENPLQIKTFIIDQNRKKILEIINQNIYLSDKEIINNILSELDISITKFYKIFNDIFEKKPSQIIGDIKMKAAFSLLLDENLSLEYLASLFSYSEVEFKNKFVALFKESPFKLKQKLKEVSK